MTKLNKGNNQIRLKRGLRAALNTAATAYLGLQGEPAYTTDTKQLFIHDGANFRPVQSLDMAVLFDNQVVGFGNAVVTFY